MTFVDAERVAGSAFGALLRRHRLAAGLSQEALAELARMSVNGIGALERGDRRFPYAQTVALLAQALGLGPDASAELRAAAARPGGRRALPNPAAGAAHGRWTTTNLPDQPTRLIGRETQIAEIVGILRDNRLVTITGAGGVGKTRIAVAVGQLLAEDMQAGAWLVELAPVTQGAFVPAALAKAMNVRESPNRPLLETLLEYLRQKSLLIVLDNCEHLIAEAAALAGALLSSCPNLRILATSREPLRIAGEHRYRLPSLRVPMPGEAPLISAAFASAFSAVLLFAERARANEHQFSLNDENASIVAEICRRLDGIPLAIELAATRVNTMPLRELLTRLHQRLRILTNGDRLSLPRHQTMRALIDWSFDLLSQPEQTLLMRLGVFAGGFTLEAAESICTYADLEEHDISTLLFSLVERSVVVSDPPNDEARYRLLQATREHALEKLCDGDWSIAARRHAEWCASFVERLDAEMWTNPAVSWLPSLRTELDNLRAALGWAIGAGGDLRIAALLTGCLQECWLLCGLMGEGRQWIETCLSRIDAGTMPALEGRLWWGLAALSVGKRSAQAAKRAIALFEAAGDRAGMAGGYASLALANWHMSLDVDAESAIDQALALYSETGQTNSMLYALALGGRAMIIKNHARGEARALLREAIAICAGFGDDLRAAIPRIALAELEFLAGHVRRAAVLSDATARLCKRDHDAMREAQALHCSAAFRIVLGEIDEAKVAAEAALRLARQTQSLLGIALALTNLATVAALQGDVRRAAHVHGYADAWLQTRGYEFSASERQARDVSYRILSKNLTDVDIAELLAYGARLSEDTVVEMAFARGASNIYDDSFI